MRRSEEVRNVLLEAADKIERLGWWQVNIDWQVGIDIDTHNGGYCALTAISVVTTYTTFERAQKRLAQYLRLRQGTSIPRWNDAPGRTKEEVITALRNAALPRNQWRVARRQAQLILAA